MKRNVLRRVAMGAAVIILGATAGAAQAATTFSEYNMTIGRWGAAYTGWQKKSLDDQRAEVVSSSVGGDYKAKVCVSGTSWCLGETKTINDKETKTPRNMVGAGATARLKFTIDGFSFVNVQVVGKWRLDKPSPRR